MSGLFSTLNVSVRGMSAQQTAIDVTSHNIANANTDGYSRQTATMETTTPFGMPTMNSTVSPGQLGTGVQISSITRIRDSYLDYQVRAENGTKGLYDGKEEFLSEIQTVFNEPSDTGVSTLIGKVYDSWQALSTSPELSSSRTVVVQQSKALTDQLNSNYNQLESLKTDSDGVIKQDVTDVNSILNQLNDLNQQIITVNVGGNKPNDLMDKRDLLEDQLSTKLGFTVVKTAYGGEDIKATGVTDANGGDVYLVKSNTTDPVSRLSYTAGADTTDGYGVLQLKDNAGGSAVDYTPATGELNGYMSVQKDIDDYEGQLNNLAKSIAVSVNTVQDDTTNAFFVSSDSAQTEITAGNISVNQTIQDDVMSINAGAGATTADSEATDGSRALAIAQLRNVKLNVQGIADGTESYSETDPSTKIPTITSSSAGMTTAGYFTDTVNKLAIQTQEAKRISTNQDTLLSSLETSRTSTSGVSLDEEMSNLIQFQHAYQANAKIISTVDELLDVIINGLKK